MTSQGNFFRNFRLLVFLVSLFTGIGLFSLSIYIVRHLSFEPSVTLTFIIVSAILSILIGAFTYVILSIPFDLAVMFDPVKNDIASGKLADINEVQNAIGEFVVDFFNYVGADIVMAAVYFKGSKAPAVTDSIVDINMISFDELKQKKKIHIDSQHKAFYVPVVFEDNELGYMLLITKGFTYSFFYRIVEYFENFFLDDLVMRFYVKDSA